MSTNQQNDGGPNHTALLTPADEKIRASELSYRRLFETAQDGILILDAATGRITDVNPFLIKLLNFSRNEIIGKTVGELSPFKDLIPNQIMLERLQQDGYVRYEDLPLETRGGRKIAVEFISNVYRAGTEQVIQCNVRDITERKHAEESLHLLSSAVAHAKESILITDAELNWPGPKIIFVNPAFTEMTGYPASEVIGKTPRILHGPHTDRGVLDRLRKNLEAGETFNGETINYRKDGKEFSLEWQVAPIRNGTGKITHFVAIQHDITERRRLEQQLRQSQKQEAIGQLAGGVAHDFNNILAVIQMQAELLKSSGNLTQEQVAVTDEINATVQRAAALTRQLLLFSRREVFQPRDLDLSESIANLTQMLGRILGDNIRIQLKLGPQPLFIHADAGMLDQVLLNLVVNARDAMPNGGQLVIETSGVEFDEFAATHSTHMRVGSFVCLSVSDSGGGIPPEIIPRIFEPFFTTKDVGKGTGLGLATVYGIVQQHQGWINVYSEINHGTTFRIYLPRLARNAGQISPPRAAVVPGGGQETILLVEDDPSLRISVRKALAQLGYRILEAPTGVKALEVWKENRADIRLLLTDLMMPDGMTGKQLARIILQDKPKLKVIYMSGYSPETVDRDILLTEGINFLAKPFPALKLAQTIRQLLDTPA